MVRKLVLLLILGVLLAACGGRSAAPSLDLSGDWKLVSLNGQPPIEGSEVTLTFENGQAGGRACNSYGGKYTLDGSKISFSELVQTEMACMDPAGVMEQESAYMQALSQVASVQRSDDTLDLLGADGAVLLSFTR